MLPIFVSGSGFVPCFHETRCATGQETMKYEPDKPERYGLPYIDRKRLFPLRQPEYGGCRHSGGRAIPTDCFSR